MREHGPHTYYRFGFPDGSTVFLSPGEHNPLAGGDYRGVRPPLCPSATVLYVGDTAKKYVICERDQLAGIGLPMTEHDKLPDVRALAPTKDRLFLVEAVTSHGPVSPKRYREIEDLLSGCRAERIYVTAFLSISDFRKYTRDITWETKYGSPLRGPYDSFQRAKVPWTP